MHLVGASGAMDTAVEVKAPVRTCTTSDILSNNDLGSLNLVSAQRPGKVCRDCGLKSDETVIHQPGIVACPRCHQQQHEQDTGSPTPDKAEGSKTIVMFTEAEVPLRLTQGEENPSQP